MKPNSRDIFLVTVGNTGTWTLAWNLYKHPGVGGIMQRRFYRNGPPNVHKIERGKVIKEGYAPDGQRQVIMTHYHAEDFTIPSMVRACDSVMTLRDPMLSMLTLVHRNIGPNQQDVRPVIMPPYHEMEGDFRVNVLYSRVGAFVSAARLWANEPYKCIAVDLLEHRDAQWREFLTSLSLEPMVPDFGVTNSSGVGQARQAYQAGDLEGMLTASPLLKGPLEELQKNTPVLRPWLERNGYKDLIWWR